MPEAEAPTLAQMTELLERVLAGSPAAATELVWIDARRGRETSGKRQREAPERRDSTVLVRVREAGRTGLHRCGAGEPSELENALRDALAGARLAAPSAGHALAPSAAPALRPELFDAELAHLSPSRARERLQRLALRDEWVRLSWVKLRMAVVNSAGLRCAAEATGAALTVSCGREPGAGSAAAAARSWQGLAPEAVVERARRRHAGAGVRRGRWVRCRRGAAGTGAAGALGRGDRHPARPAQPLRAVLDRLPRQPRAAAPEPRQPGVPSRDRPARRRHRPARPALPLGPLRLAEAAGRPDRRRRGADPGGRCRPGDGARPLADASPGGARRVDREPSLPACREPERRGAAGRRAWGPVDRRPRSARMLRPGDPALPRRGARRAPPGGRRPGSGRSRPGVGGRPDQRARARPGRRQRDGLAAGGRGPLWRRHRAAPSARARRDAASPRCLSGFEVAARQSRTWAAWRRRPQRPQETGSQGSRRRRTRVWSSPCGRPCEKRAVASWIASSRTGRGWSWCSRRVASRRALPNSSSRGDSASVMPSV